MMENASPFCRSPARTDAGGCRCLIPGFFPLLPVHFETLATGKFTRMWEICSSHTTSESWQIAGVTNPFLRQLGWHLSWTRIETGRLKRNPIVTEVRTPHEAARKIVAIRHNESCHRWSARHLLATLTEFFRNFSSVVRRVSGYKAKKGHDPHSPSGSPTSPNYFFTFARINFTTMPLWVQRATPRRFCR